MAVVLEFIANVVWCSEGGALVYRRSAAVLSVSTLRVCLYTLQLVTCARRRTISSCPLAPRRQLHRQ